jgi:hypothetical protein
MAGMARKLWIAVSVLSVLVAVGWMVWWSRNFWLVDALLLRYTVAAGLLAALATGGWELLHRQGFSLRTLLIAATLIVTTLVAIALGFDAWLAS